jgi:hypothetical protein
VARRLEPTLPQRSHEAHVAAIYMHTRLEIPASRPETPVIMRKQPSPSQQSALDSQVSSDAAHAPPS